MRDDYLLGVKKSIGKYSDIIKAIELLFIYLFIVVVDFVLRDPHQVEVKRLSSTKQLPHRQE